MKTIEERIQTFNQRGNNWIFQRVVSLDIHFVGNRPLSGSSYIKLPEFIVIKKAVMNMENKDEYALQVGSNKSTLSG